MAQHSKNLNSFYHLHEAKVKDALCQGTACFVARAQNSERWNAASVQKDRLCCLGKCYCAPASGQDDFRPIIEIHSSQPVLLQRVTNGGARTLAAYGDYAALRQALDQAPEAIIRALEDSGLRGRGGAGYPAGSKWRAVFEQSASIKYVVANADEGDPGAFSDRFLMEGDPHCLIEAMLIAAHAVGASCGYVYLRKEYPEAQFVLLEALREARSAGLLGERVLGKDFTFDIELFMGQGSYVCGEETALLNSIEGKRPEVRARPPYPTQQGLYGKPTLVNNVETLMNIPWIVRQGAGAYRSLGFSNSRGTKLLSLNSLFRRPGLYEVEFGVSLRTIVEEIGGGLKSGKLRGLMVGGPMAGVVPPHLLDTRFGYEELRAIGATIGHGGIVAFDERTSIPELAHYLFDFGAYESCGKCTPCRLGSRELEQMFGRIQTGTQENKATWEGILSAMYNTSLCGHGSGMAEFGLSLARYYPEEIGKCFA